VNDIKTQLKVIAAWDRIAKEFLPQIGHHYNDADSREYIVPMRIAISDMALSLQESPVFIVDQHENGNGGVHGTKVLDTMPLYLALGKRPQNYGVYEKLYGFWPVISLSPDTVADSILYYWNADSDTWSD